MSHSIFPCLNCVSSFGCRTVGSAHYGCNRPRMRIRWTARLTSVKPLSSPLTHSIRHLVCVSLKRVLLKCSSWKSRKTCGAVATFPTFHVGHASFTITSLHHQRSGVSEQAKSGFRSRHDVHGNDISAQCAADNPTTKITLFFLGEMRGEKASCR